MPKLGRRSEVTELDYQTSMALTKNAPFGTENTPSLKDKIIGGRYVSVLERPYGQNVPRYEKLSLVSDKPNHVDPRALNDFSRRYNKPYQEAHSYPGSPEQSPSRWHRPSQDPFSRSQPMPTKPTQAALKRPDSKDISSRYPTLPPIDENRLKNHQISTVFEPEAWTNNFRGGGDGNKENLLMQYYNGYNPRESREGGREGHGSRHSEPPPSPTKALVVNGGRSGPLSKEEFVRKLTSMLPKNVFLPDKPVLLSEDDEARLLQVLGEELRSHNPLKLRDIYLDIANSSDKNLTGYCQYQDLYYSMGRQMITLSGDLLQVTAAMFVSPERPNRDVNYEKFLSFLGMALKHFSGAGTSEQRPKTPVERQVNNYMADSEQAKLVSTVQQQLTENDYTVNFSRLEAELDRADRMGKGELDNRTIMDVCFQLNIPLQSSVLHRVLQRCRLNSYDDRYSWRVFVDFLSKAQPAVRQHSEPPRGKPPSPLHQPPTQRSRHSPPADPLWRRHEGPSQTSRPTNGYGEEQDSRTEVISRMDQNIKQLERNYQDIQDKMRPQGDRFKNFMEFANALYNQDQKYQGNLPAEDVYKWTKMYNDTGNLGMSDHDIARALGEASRGGTVHIHTYLTKLGNVAHQDKIV